MSRVQPPPGQISLDQGLHITNEVLNMMYRFFETAEDAQCIKVANAQVLLSLKHAILLIRPYKLMLTHAANNKRASPDMKTKDATEIPKRGD